MADIRLIVTDLDGTFLTTHRDAHAENVRAMRHAQDSGIMVCACTNRSWTMCRYVVKRYGFDPPTITSGGAAIIDADTEEPLFLRTIQPTALLPLLYASWHTGIETMDVCCSDVRASFGKDVEEKAMRIQVRNAVIPKEMWENHRIYHDFLGLFYAVENKSELVALTTKGQMGLLPDRLADILEQLDAFELALSEDGSIEVIPKGCGKMYALQHLCRLLHIERENVLAIGDQEHDIPMIRWAGVGVAMGQSDDLVKRAADSVTVDYRDAGVAKAIYEIAMGYEFD